MKRSNLYLRDRQIKALRALSLKTGAPVAELIRRAVDAYVTARTAETQPGQGGKRLAGAKRETKGRFDNP